MRKKETFDWLDIAADTAALGVESAEVIGLRLASAAAGRPGAAAEAWRMGSEKVIAMAELQALLLMDSFSATPASAAKRALKHYRAKVAANRRRLRRSAR